MSDKLSMLEQATKLYTNAPFNYMSDARCDKLFNTHRFIDVSHKSTSEIIELIGGYTKLGYKVKTCSQTTSIRGYYNRYLYYKRK